VNPTNDPYYMRSAHRTPGRRTMAEIQGKIVEKRERGLLSRIAHAKHDKETIAAWKLDFIRILQVFNVRSVGSVRLSLTASFQTELALNTRNITLDTHNMTLNTHDMVSGIHQNMLKDREDTDGKDQRVSDTRIPPITE